MTQNKRPKKWKMILLTWVVIYPLLNIQFMMLGNSVSDWHILLRTLLMTGILVPIMTLVMGVLQKRLFHWLRR